MLKTRWFKILNDVWGNKTRSLLVILSIAVGVGVVGIINNARYMIEDELYSQYAAGNPASVSLYTSPFQEDLIDKVETADEVDSVEARRLVQASILRADQPSSEVVLVVVPDFTRTQVNQPSILEGQETLGESEIVLERQTADALDLQVGDSVSVQLENGEAFALKVSAIAQNIYDMPYSISSMMSGFVSMDTLELMGEMPYFNRLDIVVAESNNTRNGVLEVSAQLRDEIIQPTGVFVGSIQIHPDPGDRFRPRPALGTEPDQWICADSASDECAGDLPQRRPGDQHHLGYPDSAGQANRDYALHWCRARSDLWYVYPEYLHLQPGGLAAGDPDQPFGLVRAGEFCSLLP